jgi:hypothetical protein
VVDRFDGQIKVEIGPVKMAGSRSLNPEDGFDRGLCTLFEFAVLIVPSASTCAKPSAVPGSPCGPRSP